MQNRLTLTKLSNWLWARTGSFYRGWLEHQDIVGTHLQGKGDNDDVWSLHRAQRIPEDNIHLAQATVCSPCCHLAKDTEVSAAIMYHPPTEQLHSKDSEGRNTLAQTLASETQTSLGTNLFSVFSCVGSAWNRRDGVWSDSTCKVWECWQLEDWTPSDTLIGCQFNDHCARESARCVEGAEQTTFSLLRRLRIITSPRADNATISSAIMIFQIMPSIAFHKCLLKSNEQPMRQCCVRFIFLW